MPQPLSPHNICSFPAVVELNQKLKLEKHLVWSRQPSKLGIKLVEIVEGRVEGAIDAQCNVIPILLPLHATVLFVPFEANPSKELCSLTDSRASTSVGFHSKLLNQHCSQHLPETYTMLLSPLFIFLSSFSSLVSYDSSLEYSPAAVSLHFYVVPLLSPHSSPLKCPRSLFSICTHFPPESYPYFHGVNLQNYICSPRSNISEIPALWIQLLVLYMSQINANKHFPCSLPLSDGGSPIIDIVNPKPSRSSSTLFFFLHFITNVSENAVDCTLYIGFSPSFTHLSHHNLLPQL